jgi:hypothetical protein
MASSTKVLRKQLVKLGRYLDVLDRKADRLAPLRPRVVVEVSHPLTAAAPAPRAPKPDSALLFAPGSRSATLTALDSAEHAARALADLDYDAVLARHLHGVRRK